MVYVMFVGLVLLALAIFAIGFESGYGRGLVDGVDLAEMRHGKGVDRRA